MPDLHRDVEPLTFLLGSWSGEGEGAYPTTAPFRFTEQIVFEDVGKAFLLYSQSSWKGEAETPSHFERGIVRLSEPGRVEFALAHPGHVEISEGTLEGTTIDVASTAIARTSTGSPLTALARRYRVEGGVLRYEIDMETESTPLTFHIRGELRQDA